jgi:C4-dicarboxylate transporter, DctM subunit
MVLMLIASSAVLGHFIAVTNMPQAAAEWIGGFPVPRTVIMIIIFLVYLLGGSFIDDLAFMILATPIFFPIILKLGYDPLWASIILACTVCIGAVIPPVAICVFIVKNITKQPMNVIYSGVYPFLISMIFCMVLLFIFPGLATYLPSVLMK